MAARFGTGAEKMEAKATDRTVVDGVCVGGGRGAAGREEALTRNGTRNFPEWWRCPTS